MDDLNDLQRQIEAAFSQSRPPRMERLWSCPCDECREIRAYFAERDWRGHTIEELRAAEPALFHFSSEGFQYYLPAFLLAVLEDSERAAAIPDLIVFNLSPDKTEFALERARALSPEQRAAVVRFLDHLVQAHIEGPEDVQPARQLLADSP